MMGAGLSNTTPFVSSTVKVVPTEYVMSGGAHFAITIDRELKVEGGKNNGEKQEMRIMPVNAGQRGANKPGAPAPNMPPGIGDD